MAGVVGSGFRYGLSLSRWWGPLAAYMVLLFELSARPRLELFRSAPDYLLHFGAYFVLALLAVRASTRGLREPVRPAAVLFGLMVSFVYALSDEWHQSLVPGRVASGWDLLADGLGIVAAWGAVQVFRRWVRGTTNALAGGYDSENKA